MSEVPQVPTISIKNKPSYNLIFQTFQKFQFNEIDIGFAFLSETNFDADKAKPGEPISKNREIMTSLKLYPFVLFGELIVGWYFGFNFFLDGTYDGIIYTASAVAILGRLAIKRFDYTHTTLIKPFTKPTD